MTPTPWAQAVEAGFWNRVDRRGDDECWPWTGDTDPRGYGRFYVPSAGKRIRATHVVWSIVNDAPFPEGKHACHTCDCPNCVNPRHIWAGTHRENMLDASAKGRLSGKPGVPRPKAITHCKHGHPFSGDNLKLTSEGRRCRTCLRRKDAKRRLKNREKFTARESLRWQKKKAQSLLSALTDAAGRVGT